VIIRRVGVLAAAAACALPVLTATAANAAPPHPVTIASPAYTGCNYNPGPWGLHTSALNIRSRPSTSSTVLGVLYKGQKWRVNSYTRGETWVNITDLNTHVRGWVSGR
jgi:uncharacterized protein YgiM (DUF1202 family)